MNGIYAELLTLAKKLNNRLVDSGTWDATTYHRYVVPAGKRWFVFSGHAVRSDSSTITVAVVDAANAVLQGIVVGAAAAGGYTWPNTDDTINNLNSGAFPLILDAGEKIAYTFGVAQGATAFITCNALEVDV